MLIRAQLQIIVDYSALETNCYQLVNNRYWQIIGSVRWKLALDYIDILYIQIPPENCTLTWLSGSEHCSVGLEHCIVDEFLVIGE